MLFLGQEGLKTVLLAFRESTVESTVSAVMQWLRLVVEIIGAIIVVIGVAAAVFQFVEALLGGDTENYNKIRLTLARYLGLALEFQLGADILSTAIAPSWEQIGKLAAIAVIRTGLNYFLMREMETEKAATQSGENKD